MRIRQVLFWVLTNFILFINLYSQPVPAFANLSISIYDSLNKPVKYVWVKINKGNSSLLLSYLNSGDTNVVKVEIPSSWPDSFMITASASGYQDFKLTVQKSTFENQSRQISITLLSKNNTLPDVVVNAPAVWTRGDTTFFKAEAFKVGGERKLIEIITKMPGFEIDKSGQLLYKKKPIEKITIEGEEIFAEKLQLMLNSFPLHVLENVQAIENQTNNPLLRGIKDEQKVFLNLSLKKDKIKAAFGDGDLGIGNKERYLVNAVVFALYNKSKIGFIANYNSLGTGFDWKAEDALKRIEEREADNWMLNQSIFVVNNVEARRYLRNRLFDNHVQFNIPIHPKITLKNEVTLTKDRQDQRSFFEHVFINGDNIINRYDSLQFTSQPFLLQTQTKFEIKHHDKKMTRVALGLYGNFTKQSGKSFFDFGGGITSNNRNSLQHNYLGLNLNIDQTNRISSDKARSTLIQLSSQNFNQRGFNFSNDFGYLFNVPLYYNLMNLSPQLNRTILKVSNEQLRKKGKQNFSYGWLTSWQNTYFQIAPFLYDSLHIHEKYKLETFSQQATLNLLKVGGFLHRNYIVGKSPLKLKLNGGLVAGVVAESQNKSSNLNAWMDFDAYSFFKLSRKRSLSVTLRHVQDFQPSFSLMSGFRPRNFQQFVRNTNFSVPLIKTNFIGYLNLGTLGRSSTGIHLNFNRHWHSPSFYFTQNSFFQFSSDSIIRKVTNQIALNTSTSFIWTNVDLMLRTNLGIIYNERLYHYSKTILSGSSVNYFAGINISKSWQKKTSFVYENRFGLVNLKLPSTFKGPYQNLVGEWWQSLSIRSVFRQVIAFQLKLDHYHNNLFTPNRQIMLMGDAEVSYNPKDSKLHYSLRIENLTNQKEFFRSDIGDSGQSFFRLPFVRRNFICFVKFDL